MIHFVMCEHYSKYLKLLQTFSRKKGLPMPVFRAVLVANGMVVMSLLIFQQEQSDLPSGKVSVKLWFSGMSLSYFMAFHKHCITKDDGDSIPTWVIFFLFTHSLTQIFHAETSYLSRYSAIKHSADWW